MAGSDVFISYKSEQAGWAERLEEDLRRYGLTVFRDHDTAAGLQVGADWEHQIEEEARAATHFVLLSSALITAQSYVNWEIKYRQDAGGKVVVVHLDNTPPPAVVVDRRQGFREFIDLVAAHADARDVPFFEWQRAVRHLVRSAPLGDGRRSSVVEIPTVVVAMTAAQAKQLAKGQKVVPGIKQTAYQQMMGLLSASTPLQAARYGGRPEEWKPFAPVFDPGDPTVEEVISGFDDAHRLWRLENQDDADDGRYAFVPYGDALRDPASVKQARERLKRRASLIVFDPVSLMHQDVSKFVLDNGLHTLTMGFVIGLGPQLTTSSAPVRDYYGGVEQTLFEGLMMTDPRDRARARFYPTLSTCVLNVNREFELSRWLQIASEGIIDWVGRLDSQMDPAYRGVVASGGPMPRIGLGR